MATDEIRYSAIVFFKAALPLMKYIAADVPSLAKDFKGVNAVYQISAKKEDGTKEATHFIVTDGVWDVKFGCYEGGKIDGELAFSSYDKFVAFMKGNMAKLPAFKIGDMGKFIKMMKVLLKMSSLLNTAEPPENDEETSLLLVKLYYYLLSTGISALNKAGEPKISNWIASSPDRVYQWEVIGHPELTAHIRIDHGKSKACKGAYERSNPFFIMRYDNATNALKILLDTGDMFDMTAAGELMLVGGPEFGVQLGDAMMTVGGYAK